MAYNRVEEEIYDIETKLRKLRQEHQAEEQAIERRLAQKKALRQRIMDGATG